MGKEENGNGSHPFPNERWRNLVMQCETTEDLSEAKTRFEEELKEKDNKEKSTEQEVEVE